ncbi:unnamed protein product [Calypogeia fissa]
MENHHILTLEGLASSGCIVPSEQRCAIGISLKFKKKDAGLRSLSLWGRIYTQLGKDYLLAEGVKSIKLVDRRLVIDTRYYFSQNGALWLDLQAPTEDQFITCKKISGLFKGDPSHTYFVPDPPPPPPPPPDPFAMLLPKAPPVPDKSGGEKKEGEEAPKEGEESDPDATSESEPEEPEEVAVEDDEEGPDPELNPEEEEGEKEPEPPKGQDVGELVRLASLMRWIDEDCGVVPIGGMVLDGNKNLVQNCVFPGMKFPNKLDSYGHLFRGYEKAPLSKDIAGFWSVVQEDLSNDVQVRSLLWPGYHFYYSGTNFDYGSLYFGWGEKNKDIAFMINYV